jgi:hypothetical protein
MIVYGKKKRKFLWRFIKLRLSDDHVVNNLKILLEESLYRNSEHLESVESKHQQSCFISENDY